MIDSETSMKQISSAEMTAYWRTVDSKLSGDSLSRSLATAEGIAKAKLFEKNINYPLIGRAISVRAGYFLRQAVTLLQSGKYDACISFASGFSLLTSYIQQAVANPAIQFYDTDLATMITLRQSRLDSTQDDLATHNLTNTHLSTFDLEALTNKKTCLATTFPQIKNPLILLEGIVYFITPNALNALFHELFNYESAAVILDYFPEDAIQKSQCFARMYHQIGDFMPEVIKALINQEMISNDKNKLHILDHSPLSVAETTFCKQMQIPTKLINPDEFFPVQLMTLVK